MLFTLTETSFFSLQNVLPFPAEYTAHIYAFCTQLFYMLRAIVYGTLLASLVEITGVSHYIAYTIQPLIRIAHLPYSVATACASSFVSPYTAQTLLGDAYMKGLSKKELFITNIVLSFPTACGHAISLLVISYPLIGTVAIQYVTIILLGALLRTVIAVCIGAYTLPVQPAYSITVPKQKKVAYAQIVKRFKKRLGTLCLISIPVYCIIYIATLSGIVEYTAEYIQRYIHSQYITPESIGIIATMMLTQSIAGITATSVLLNATLLTPQQALFALVLGNIFSSPARTIRLQLPMYTAFYSLPTALGLIAVNQGSRVLSMLIIFTLWYYWYF